MKTIAASVLLIFIGFVTSLPAWAEQTGEVLNNASIIELKQAGFGEGFIVDKIKSSPGDFDMSLAGLKQLKAAGIPDVVLSAMLPAKSPAKGNGDPVAVEPSADPNDPKSPHEAGIWLYEESTGKPQMIQLEPSVYSQSKSGVGFFMQYGQTVKGKAVIRSAHAGITTANRQPVFYFYFEHTQSGLSDFHGATSPNEYILAQFEVAANDNERRLVMSSINAYTGGASGTESQSVRSFAVQKLAPGIYKVSPKEALSDGEYGFFYGSNQGGGKVFDFGVQGSPGTEPMPPVVETMPQDSKKHRFKDFFQKKTDTATNTTN